MLDQFDMAAMMPMVAAILASVVVTELQLHAAVLIVVIAPMVAAILATLVITKLHAVLIVTVLVVIVIPVTMAADDDLAVVRLIVR